MPATQTTSCIVLVTCTAGREFPVVEFYGDDLAGAVSFAAKLRAEHAADVAHDQVMIARKAAKGVFNHESTPAITYQVKRVNGARAAKMIELNALVDFYSQDEADLDSWNRVSREFLDTYLSA